MKTPVKGFLLILFFACLFISCKDEDVTGGYYFRINYSGNTYNYESDLLQIGNNETNEFGGWVPGNGDAAGIFFTFSDTVTSADVLGLSGKSFSFSASAVPEVEIKNMIGLTKHYSNASAHSAYYINITEVKFLRNENALFDVDVYSVKGDFSARMETIDGNYIDDATGEFYLQCTYGNY